MVHNVVTKECRSFSQNDLDLAKQKILPGDAK